jgi:hypothetical protein
MCLIEVVIKRVLLYHCSPKNGFYRNKTIGFLISSPANSIMKRFWNEGGLELEGVNRHLLSIRSTFYQGILAALVGLTGLVILLIAIFYPQAAGAL